MIFVNTIELDAPADQAYTLAMEVYRLPSTEIALGTDSPEIAGSHHEQLLNWCAKDYFALIDPAQSEFYEKIFEDYFGVRKTATARRRSRENLPQHNKVW